MSDEIKYLGFYSLSESKYKRTSALSAISKMDYISDTLNRLGYKVCLVSPSWIIGKGFEFQSKVRLSESKQVIFSPSFGTNNKVFTYISIIISLIWLLIWLLFNVKTNEKVIVYHSPWLALPVLWAKKIKGFKVILEVEEVYSDVSSILPFLDRMEYKIFEVADSFLFSTDLLAKKLNRNKKPFLVLYGNYNVPETLGVPFDDSKIHLLYAGIIDSHKAGAFNAIEAATYLNENYVMHIIGFGEVNKLEKRIKEINRISKCKVLYEGIKSGEEYIRFCQSCHIGLSTQNMEGSYLETSFPSKILSYLGMGLRVVSCEISCVSKSKIDFLLNYYSSQKPNSISNAILNIDFDSIFDGKEIIEELNLEFQMDFKNILYSEI